MNLTAHDLEMFSKLKTPAELLQRAGIKRVTNAEAREEYGIRGGGDMSGIVFPYWEPGSMIDGKPWKRWNARIRRDNPEIEVGKIKKKYVAPYGDRRHLYFPPCPELFANASVPICFVEAEKSALALHAWAQRTSRKLLAIAMGGCYGWRGKVGIRETSTGERVPEYGPIQDLNIARDGRKTYVLLDANCASNPQVSKARQELVRQLRKQRADVHVLDLPAGEGINGPDDYIGAMGDESMMALFDGVEAGSLLLDEIERYIRRFAVLTPEQSAILAVYVLHTHVLTAGRFTPYLQIWSAVMQSGKTRVLELLQLLVHNPWLTGRVSAAALIRKIAKSNPTLLLDESDAAFGADKEYSETLRGILNSGFQKGGCANVCVKKNGEWDVQELPVFGCKVIAGIGMEKLPATVRDRSIPIEMRRRSEGESVEDFDTDDEIEATRPIRERIAAWAQQNGSRLRSWPKPEKLPGLRDRQRDICNPLLKIAEIAGGNWPSRLADALTKILGTRGDDESIGSVLLTDIRNIFAEREKMFSEDLAASLSKIETSPWGEWKNGKPITAIQLARQLKPFRIFPKDIRIDKDNRKGYERDQFADAWSRYLRPESAHCPNSTRDTVTSQCLCGETPFSTRDTNPVVTTPKSEESPVFMRIVTGVTTQKGGIGKKDAVEARL
jgi:hypothetical protein